MRILWHSTAPWDGTGYGNQTAIWTRWLRDQGHEVAISTYHGSPGLAQVWEGITVLPPPLFGPGDLLLHAHAQAFKPDLVIILGDVWVMDPRQLDGLRAVAWVATDTSPGPLGQAPLSTVDYLFLQRSGIQTIAMSKYGQAAIEQSGFAPLYVPHGIDTSIFTPAGDRAAIRERFGISPATFVVGINANNVDPYRKAYTEQFAAFARFHVKHPDSLLMIHSVSDLSFQGSLNLGVIAAACGITGCTWFCDQYTIQAGGYTQQDMADWYAALDVYSGVSYGEGFGLPSVEAQACGTPVILSRGTTGPELVGPGWLVNTRRWWNKVHQSWWHAPDEDSILAAYEAAYLARGNVRKRAQARKFAERYSIDKVGALWDQALRDLTDPDSARVVESDGLKWKVSRSAGHFGDNLGLDTHETSLQQHVYPLIPADGVFVDVGAHVGHWALRAARRCARVIAIEADAPTAARLRENIALNDLGNVEVHNVAAWDSGGWVKLIARRHGYDRDGTTQTRPLERSDADTSQEEVAKAVRLDVLLAGSPRVDVVKIDVEGADLHVIRGLRGVLEAHKPVLFIEDHSVYGMYERASLDELLSGVGYIPDDISPGYLIARPAG